MCTSEHLYFILSCVRSFRGLKHCMSDAISNLDNRNTGDGKKIEFTTVSMTRHWHWTKATTCKLKENFTSEVYIKICKTGLILVRILQLQKHVGMFCTTLKMVKVKLSLCFNWAPRHEGVLEEWRYSSIQSLTSALYGGEWSDSRPGRFTPREIAFGTHWIGGRGTLLNFSKHEEDTSDVIKKCIIYISTLRWNTN
jgi:hypothetical protein